MATEEDKVMSRITRGLAVSARRDWEALVHLADAGKLTTRLAPNGQIEYLHDGKPVRVGP